MSELALARLKEICDEKIPEDYEIEVIDVAKHPDVARTFDIVATPAVFRKSSCAASKQHRDLSLTRFFPPAVLALLFIPPNSFIAARTLSNPCCAALTCFSPFASSYFSSLTSPDH